MSTSTMQRIILYDTPSRMGKAWNTVVLRIRFCLGFKGLSYRTEWVEHPQIEATLKEIGAAPTGIRSDGTGRPFYTVPVIIDPNHLTEEGKPTIISDSRNIALYLDEHYPTTNKPLIPNGTNGLQAVCEEYFIQNVLLPIAGHLMLQYHNILNEESQPYFRETRERFFKGKLEDFSLEDSQKREQTLERVREDLSKLATLLKDEKNQGPFLTGSAPLFIDFVIVVILETFASFMPKDWEERVSRWDDGKWKAHRDACAPYLESSDVKTA